MTNITVKCPNCGETIKLGENESAMILQQVQSEEFNRQVNEQVAEIEKHLMDKHVLEVEKEVNSALRESDKIHEAKTQEMNKKLEDLTAKLQMANGKIVQLNSKIEANDQATNLAVLKATSEVREQMDAQRVSYEEKLANERALANAEKAKLEYSLEQEKAQTEFYKDLKTKMSTKMVGETLEQHCENSFNMQRTMSFPNAEFGKDNDAKTGSKGDYIYREKDLESGAEILSIMFEMKNETDSDSVKHKNEEFFKELDKDRREKNCEYAVLVTLLEPESELYNSGIIDVSYKYPKMFVVRPQNFLAIIGLLRNAALSSLAYKKELAIVRAQNCDISDFEDKLLAFKSNFGGNVEKAGKNFNEAIASIDKSIEQMQKTKEKLLASLKQLEQANKKVDDITIKKLTKGNPTVQAMIEQAREAKMIDSNQDKNN